MSESVNPYLGPMTYLTSPAGRVDVEVTGAGVEMAVSEDLPGAAREAVRALGPTPQKPRGLTAVEGEAAWEGDVVADWDEASQEVAWSIVGHPPRSSSLDAFGDDLAAAWADHAASLAAAAPLVERLRGLAPGGLDPEEAVVTWDPQARLARMDVDMAPVPGRGGEAPGVRMTVTTGEAPDHDVVVRIEGDGHPEGTSMSPDQARGVVAQAVRDAASTPADVAWRALEPAVETLASLPGMDGIAVEDPVLLEDGSLSVQLHPDWDGPSTETSVTLTAPGHGGPVTVRAGGPATQDLLTGRATPHQLAEGAWLTGVSPDLAAQPDPARLGDTQAAALVLGAPQDSVTQAVDTLAVGLEAARLDAWDATQGARPLATTRFRDQQARAATARALADSLVLGVDGHDPAAVAARAARAAQAAEEVSARSEAAYQAAAEARSPVEPRQEHSLAALVHQVRGDLQRLADPAWLRDRLDDAVLASTGDWDEVAVVDEDGARYELREPDARDRREAAEVADLVCHELRERGAVPGQAELDQARDHLASRAEALADQLIPPQAREVVHTTVDTTAGTAWLRPAAMDHASRPVAVGVRADDSVVVVADHDPSPLTPDSSAPLSLPKRAAAAVASTPAGARRAVEAALQPSSGVTIYTTPGCMGCEMTRRQLDRAGVAYQAVDLSTRPDLAARLRDQGLGRAPVVETPDGQRTAGFDPDRIRAVVAMASSPTPPTAPAPAPAPSPGSDEAQRPGRSPAAAEQASRSRGAGL